MTDYQISFNSKNGHQIATAFLTDGTHVDFLEEPLGADHAHGYGHLPLDVGQIVDGGNLKIIGKLGWSVHSSVWLAHVERSSAYPAKYVAVKALTVAYTEGVMDGQPHHSEYNVLTAISKGSGTGKSYLCRFYGDFVEESDFGPHICLVTEVLGPTVTSIRMSMNPGPLGTRALPMSIAKKIIKQTLSGLDYLHTVCNYVNVDTKEDNILFVLPDIDSEIARQVGKRLWETKNIQVPGFYKGPFVSSRSLSFSRRVSLNSTQVKLVDFGSAHPANSGDNHFDQSYGLRAPEVILGYQWSTPVDIWSVGVMFYELITGGELFMVDGKYVQSIHHFLLMQMLSCTGQKFDTSFLKLCTHHADHFDANGELKGAQELRSSTFEEMIRQYGTVQDRDIGPAANFLRKCLTLNPTRRPTAAQLIRDSFLRDV